MRRLLLGVVMLALTGFARADITPPSLRDAAAGDWRLSEVGGKVACTLSLTRQTTPDGFEVHAPLACRRAFPPLKEVSAWAMDDKGAIALVDSQHQRIIVFPEVAGAPYQAKAPDGHTWRLEPVVKSPSPASTPIGGASPPAVQHPNP
ncbi:MAG: AprI/Inh family metalloprotease inhibitor [Caulobacterales bacterium]